MLRTVGAGFYRFRGQECEDCGTELTQKGACIARHSGGVHFTACAGHSGRFWLMAEPSGGRGLQQSLVQWYSGTVVQWYSGYRVAAVPG